MRQAKRLLGLTFSCESEARSRSGRRDHVQMIEYRAVRFPNPERIDDCRGASTGESVGKQRSALSGMLGD